MPHSAAVATRQTPGGVRLVATLALVMFINYLDRGTVATAAPLIRDPFHLNSTQLGLLPSAFFCSYTLFLFPASWVGCGSALWLRFGS